MQSVLELTPPGLRETAIDGTPRRAKAAGAKLRKLTESLYERLLDPRLYGIAVEEDLEDVWVKTTFWDYGSFGQERGHWSVGTRKLKRCGGRIATGDHPGYWYGTEWWGPEWHRILEDLDGKYTNAHLQIHQIHCVFDLATNTQNTLELRIRPSSHQIH